MKKSTKRDNFAFFIDVVQMLYPLKIEDASQHGWTPKEKTFHATRSYSYFINNGVALLCLEVNLLPPKVSSACVR